MQNTRHEQQSRWAAAKPPRKDNGMTFRGKQWQRNGNHFLLVGTNIAIYQWNTGEKANFLVEERGKGTHTVHGKGSAARDAAIKMAFDLAGKEIA